MQPTQSTRPSVVAGETLATYRWVPPGYHAAAFLLHGFRSHARFNFLRNDSPASLRNYGDAARSSFVRELNEAGLAVFAHDHVGHGESTGLRGYFPSFDSLVADAVSYVRDTDEELQLSQRGIPIFLVGHSLGGTIAITATRDYPSLFKGMALSSAASEPPAGMFGLKGRIQLALSSITSALIPTVPLLALPKSEDAKLQAIFEADPLNCFENLRARVGREFINAYSDISARLSEVSIPFLTISGDRDTLVNPQAAKRFFDGAASTDKTHHVAEGRWHNLLVEDGREKIWDLILQWILARSKEQENN